VSVRNVLRTKAGGALTVAPDASLAAAAGIFVKHEIGGLPVEEVMLRPAPTCSPEDDLRGIMERMTRQRLRHLVVVDGDAIVGVLSVGDRVKHRLEELETEAGVLRDYVAAQRVRG